ncbi:MAG: methyltransferase [Planctomycetota bacterium]|nr:MAG: methyltransferase [Planctomycetota bacterium]
MDYNNKPDRYYSKIRQEMIDFLPSTAKTVLDIGCGEAAFASFIKDKFGAEVWGMERTPGPAAVAETKLDKVLVGDCESRIKDLPDGYFDAVYFNDVLEHLVDPYEVLTAIKSKLSPNGVVISSIPNVRYFRVLKMLLVNKDWGYEKDGVMDRTHLRFFTSKSIRRIYKDLGYEILAHRGINRTKSLKPYLYNIPLFFSAMDMFYIQYATVAKKSPE